MNQSASLILSDAAISALTGIERGIEKEGLRFTPDGTIAQTPHPLVLGSTLTHPYITTDYSEALLEFITPKSDSLEQSLSFLRQLHSFTLANVEGEEVWPASMPCKLEGESSIPIAEYGSSNVGQMKHIYRRGLEVRYGRIMQAIAGIHYNISLPESFWLAYQAQLNDQRPLAEFRSDQYFHLIRNFHRHSWVLYYLFGASPVVDSSFFDDRAPALDQYGERTWGLPYATSLRMSDLGYTNSAQKDLHIGYDSLDDYIKTLSHAVHQPYAAYEALGVKDQHGDYQQLNANILQIENEYYSEIRPKRVARSGERPVQALQRGGVEYIEVRALDINPYLDVGLDEQEARFIDAFVLYCLVSNSPQQCPNEWAEIAENRATIIKYGRQPDLSLGFCGATKSVSDWVADIVKGTMQCAEHLDAAYGGDDYKAATSAQLDKARDPALTPSGKLMAEVEAGNEFFDIVNSLSSQHKAELLKGEHNFDHLTESADTSLQEFSEREQQQEIPFSEYLDAYNEL
ncbi:MAG: glutamate--cysteine ligase [Pseudomonadota bacterium]